MNYWSDNTEHNQKGLIYYAEYIFSWLFLAEETASFTIL